MFERSDRYLGIACIVFGAIVFWDASRWKVLMKTDPAGPGAVPKILAISIAVIGLVLIIGSLIFARLQDKKAIFTKAEMKPILLISVISFAYIILLEHVGYLFMTPLLIIGLMAVANVRKLKTLLSVGIGATLVLFVLFFIVLKVQLPMGLLDDVFDGLQRLW